MERSGISVKEGAAHGRPPRIIIASLAAALMLLVASSPAPAQRVLVEPGTWSYLVDHPYAGKIEARIGGAGETENDKLRLDIGGSVDLWSEGPDETIPAGRDLRIEAYRTSFGADFFTWTRLRAAGGFKFPVEAVDYYFGVNAARRYNGGLLRDLRVRVAHISAHLVDGDPSFTNPGQQYITYSREFIDAMVGFDAARIFGSFSSERSAMRLYAGGLWMFHTIPDTLGVFTPYAGIDGYMPIVEDGMPLTLKYGYEARLNTELEPIGEHQLRAGVKLGRPRSNGVLIEASYYSGRSMYGQHFSHREKFFSIGFAIDM